jgi:hypothetical protein
MSLIQALFLPFGSEMSVGSFFVFNMYTVPAYTVIALSVFTIVLLQTCFKEQYSGVLTDAERKSKYMGKFFFVAKSAFFQFQLAYCPSLTNLPQGYASTCGSACRRWALAWKCQLFFASRNYR